MKTENFLKVFVVAFTLLIGTSSIAQDKNIVETAIGSEVHTT